MADANSTVPNNKQLMTALEEIVFIANIIDSLHFYMDEKNAEALTLASRQLAISIGVIADRCTGFQIKGFDSWMLPPTFESQIEEATN